MPTRTAKTGYWRINKDTGEAEWIEGSYQPSKPTAQPALTEEQLVELASVGEVAPSVPPVIPTPATEQIAQLATVFETPPPELLKLAEQEVAKQKELPFAKERKQWKDLETSLRTAFPEMFDTRRYAGVTEEDIPLQAISELATRMEMDYGTFLQDITARVGRYEAENILKQFGVREEAILGGLDIQEQEQRLLTAFQTVIPEIKSLEEPQQWTEPEWESFLETIREGGGDVEKRRLLELIGFAPEEINDIFMNPRLVVPLDGIRQLVDVDLTTKMAYDIDGNYVGMFNPATREFTKAPPKNVFKQTWDWLGFSTRSSAELGVGFMVGALPEIIFFDIPLDREKRDPLEKLFSEDAVRSINEFNRQQREFWRWTYGDNKRKYEEWQRKNPDVRPSVQFQEGAFKNPEVLKDPMYYVYELTNILPLVLATAAVGIGTGGTGVPFFVTSTGMMGAVEGGAVYQDLLDAGAPEDKAGKMALIAGGIIGSLESVGRIPLLRQVSPMVFGLFKREAGKELARRGLAETIKKFGRNYTITMFSESATEVAQEIVGNVAVRVYDENRSIFENVPDIFVKTLLGMQAFSLFGAGVSVRMVKPSQLSGLSDAARRAKGWVSDNRGNWFEALKEEKGAFVPGAEPGGIKPLSPEYVTFLESVKGTKVEDFAVAKTTEKGVTGKLLWEATDRATGVSIGRADSQRGAQEIIERVVENKERIVAPAPEVTKRYTLEGVPETEVPIGKGITSKEYLINDIETGRSIGSFEIAEIPLEDALAIVNIKVPFEKMTKARLAETLSRVETEAIEKGKNNLDIIGYPKHSKIYQAAGYEDIGVPAIYKGLFDEEYTIFRKKLAIPKAEAGMPAQWKLTQKESGEVLLYRGEMGAPQGLLKVDNLGDAQTALDVLNGEEGEFTPKQAYRHFDRATAADERWLKNKAQGITARVESAKRYPKSEKVTPMTLEEFESFLASQKIVPEIPTEPAKPPVARPSEVEAVKKEIISGITEVEETPTVVVEEKVTPPTPPIQPPQTVEVPVLPPSPDAKKRVTNQSQEVVRQSMPGAINRLFQKIPGIGQIMRWERPALRAFAEGNPHLIVAQVAETAARSDVAAREVASRLPLFKQLHDVFGEKALRGEKTDITFIGTEEQATNPITGTLFDIAQNPELYKLAPSQLSALQAINEHNDATLDYVVNGYGAEIGRFAPKPNGAFLSNVDISEDMLAWFETESRAVAQGRSKTRFWKTARDRMVADKTFQPELDIKKLIEGMDSFKASQAGGVTFKEVAGGKTRLEVIQETHPALYNRMMALRAELQALKRNLANLETRLEDRVTQFLESPAEDVDLAELQESLDVRLQKGRFVQFNIEALQEQIDTTREQIKELRTPWKVANPKPYVFVQQGLYRYFKPLEAKYIIDSRKTTNNPILNFIERWRGQAFSGDFSPFAIQGTLGVLADPIGSLKATAGGIQAARANKDLLHSITVEGLIDDINSDIEGWAEFASLMGRSLTGVPREYAAGFLSSIPGFDKFTETTYITVTRGTKNLYDRTWQGLVKNGVPELEAKVAAIEVAQKVYPLVNPAKLGQSQARAAVLRAMPTSYSFIRQPATLIAQASMGYAKLATFQKLTPQERIATVNVTRMAASILAVSATSAVLSAIAQGKDDDEVWQAFLDAINPDPYNGKFASIIIGDFRVPLGGPYRAIFRAIYPQEVKGVPFPVPFAGIPRFVFNRITPAVKTQINLLMNKDYYGKQIIKGQFPENIIRIMLYEMEGALPLSFGELMAGFRREEFLDEIVQQSVAQFVGVNLIKLDNTYFHKLVNNLGISKSEAPLLYSTKRPYFTTKDLWSGVTRVLSDVTLDEVKQRKGYPKHIAIIIEARDLKREVDLLPNYSPVSLKPEDVLGEKGYYAQWTQRQSLVEDGDDAEWTVQGLVGGRYKSRIYKGEDAIKAFDKENPQAELGNMSQRQYSLLVQYHALTDDKDKKQFLIDHPEIGVKPRDEYLHTHPKENARLAVWGQAKILTKEAYNEFNRLIKELDIPDVAIPETTLPPEGSIDNYFKYQDMENKNSWEAQLMMAQDDDLREFLGRQPIDTPIEALELKVNNREHYDAYDLLETDEERKQYYIDNPGFRDDVRRIEAIEKNGIDFKEDWVDRGKTIDEFGAGSSEAKVWLLDHPEAWRWALDNEILTDDGKDWNEVVLRLNVELSKLELDSEEYKLLSRQREAHTEGFGNFVDEYVHYYDTLTAKGFRRERMMYDADGNLTPFGQLMKDKGKKILPFNEIPNEEYDNIYDEWREEFENPNAVRWTTGEQTYAGVSIKNKLLTGFGLAEIKRDAYGEFIPDEHIDTYVQWRKLQSEGRPEEWADETRQDYWFEDDWFLMENKEFYQNVYLGDFNGDGKPDHERKDFRKVPTRKVFEKYLVYVRQPHQTAKKEYRLANLDLDEWGQIMFDWKPIEEQEIKEGLTEEEEFWEWFAELRKPRKRELKIQPIK